VVSLAPTPRNREEGGETSHRPIKQTGSDGERKGSTARERKKKKVEKPSSPEMEKTPRNPKEKKTGGS